MKNSNKLDDMAYTRGRDDARCGLPRFPQCQHPDQYGAYNAGFRDWGKLQEFPAMVEALRKALSFMEDVARDNSIADTRTENEIRAILARIDGHPTPIEAPEAPTVEIQPEPELGRFVLQDYRTLAGGLMEMIDGGRLSAADMPDDFEWLESKLLYLAAHDKGAEQRETLADVRRRYSMQGEG